MFIRNKQDIVNRLTPFCKTIRVETDIIVVGSASILLNYNTYRLTQDIDILTKVRTQAAVKYDISIVNEGILFLTYDYKERLIFHGRVGVVNIYALHPLDLSLVKLGRGSDKDIDDIKYILKSRLFTLQEYVEKYKEFRQTYGGDTSIIDNNFRYITGISFNDTYKRLF